MATYAAYRHIELDKVGYSKKRVRNPPSDIQSVMSTPNGTSPGARNGRSVVDGTSTPRRRTSDSFNRLFGEGETKPHTPRRASLTKHDVTNRNPVTGNGVQSWDSRRNQSKIHTERNPVTGEVYQIISPSSTPTKSIPSEFPKITNGNAELPAGPVTNGLA